jgi:prepilin-type N-terminal cleavage/methylation domain-containing protein
MGFGAGGPEEGIMLLYISKRARRGRGFTLIELAVVVAVVGILAAALLNRVVFYQEQAEKVAVEQLLGTLRSALHLQIADLLVQGKTAEINRLSDQNPMDWLAEKPSNYIGEYYTPKPGLVPAGNWYFDLHNKNLVYLVNNHAHLHTAPGESNKVRFQVKLVMSLPSNGSSAVANPANIDRVEGVILEQVISYNWF